MVNLLSWRRVTAIILIPIILALIINAGLFYFGARSLLIHHYKNNAYSLADNILEEVEIVLKEGDPDSLISLFQLLNETPGIYSVHVRFNDGRTIWGGMKQNATYALVFKDEFTDENIDVTKNIVETNKNLLQLAYPIYIPQKVGILRLDYSLKEMNRVVRNTFFVLTLFTGISIFAIMLLGNFISKGVTKPFQQLERIYDKYSRVSLI